MKRFCFRTEQRTAGLPFWLPCSFGGWLLRAFCFLLLLAGFILLFCIPTLRHTVLPDPVPDPETSEPAEPVVERDTIVLGTGDVQITLIWDTVDDVDLHCIDPSGHEIHYAQKTSPSGGMLDVDMNASSCCQHPVENIFWPDGRAPHGTYRVWARLYRVRQSPPRPVDYSIRIKAGASDNTYYGSLSKSNVISRKLSFDF